MDIDKTKSIFYALIYSFNMQAMIHMGKIANPVSNKTERDLNAAEMSIDMLDMLKIKTAGNLDDEEKNLLETTLTNLHLNFAAEKEKPDTEDKTNIKEETK